MSYRANVTDKQQTDIERAADDSAIRVFGFDGKVPQTGEVKVFRANDLQPQGNAVQRTTDAHKMNANIGVGGIGSHNDQPHRFVTPGKA